MRGGQEVLDVPRTQLLAGAPHRGQSEAKLRPVQPRHAVGADHEGTAGAPPVERASHREGAGRTASAGLELRPPARTPGLFIGVGGDGCVSSSRARHSSVRPVCVELQVTASREPVPLGIVVCGPARASWLCGPLLSAAVTPPRYDTSFSSPLLSADSQGLPSIFATGHCHESPKEPVRVSSPLRAGAEQAGWTRRPDPRLGAACTCDSPHHPKVATATSSAARTPVKEGPRHFSPQEAGVSVPSRLALDGLERK